MDTLIVALLGTAFGVGLREAVEQVKNQRAKGDDVRVACRLLADDYWVASWAGFIQRFASEDIRLSESRSDHGDHWKDFKGVLVGRLTPDQFQILSRGHDAVLYFTGDPMSPSLVDPAEFHMQMRSALADAYDLAAELAGPDYQGPVAGVPAARPETDPPARPPTATG